MSIETCFRIVTRGLTICALAWMAGNLVFLPPDILGMLHHLQSLRIPNQPAALLQNDRYWVRYYLYLSAARVLMIMFDLWLAMWLYRGASGARKFFGLDEVAPE